MVESKALVCRELLGHREASSDKDFIALLDLDDDAKAALIRAIAKLCPSEATASTSFLNPSMNPSSFQGSSYSSSSIFSLLAGSYGPAISLTPQNSAETAAINMTFALASSSSDSGDLSPQLLSLVSSFRSQLEELRQLGKGGQGSVSLMRSKLDNRLIAVKRVLFRSKCPPWEPFEQKMEAAHSRMLREVRVLASLDFSPHVVKYYSSWIEPDWKKIATTFKHQRSQALLSATPVHQGKLLIDHDKNSSAIGDMEASASYEDDSGSSSSDKDDDNLDNSSSQVTKNSAFTFDRDGGSEAVAVSNEAMTMTKSKSCVILEEEGDRSQFSKDSSRSRSQSSEETISISVSVSAGKEAIVLAPNCNRNAVGMNEKVKRKPSSSSSSSEQSTIKWPYVLNIAMEPIIHGLTLDAWLKRRTERRKMSPLLLTAPNSSTSASFTINYQRDFCLGAVEKEIFRQIAVGLAHIHAANVLHRDLKPSNLFIIPSPPAEILVKLIDFGLSTLISSDSSTSYNSKSTATSSTQSFSSSSPPSPTSSPLSFDDSTLRPTPFPPSASSSSKSSSNSNHTIKIGTPSYAAPEQLRGKGRYGPSVDIYPLGLILLELCTPFGTAMERAMALGRARGSTPPDSNSNSNPALFTQLPPGMEEVLPLESTLIRKLLSQDPNLRPTSWELCETLSRIWGGPGGGPEGEGTTVSRVTIRSLDADHEGEAHEGSVSSTRGGSEGFEERGGKMLDGYSTTASLSFQSSSENRVPQHCIVEEHEDESEEQQQSQEGSVLYKGEWICAREMLSLLISRDEEIERLRSRLALQ